MTSYGTIPTSSHAPGTSTNLEFISRAKQRIKSGFSTRRPWKLMFNLHSFNLPSGLRDAISRLKTNLPYFRMNYAIILLIILFLSLLWHPVSLIVFVVMLVAWLFLYFLRDEPLVVLNRVIDDRIVLGVLAILTVGFLLLTGVTWNVVGSVLIGLGLIVFHGLFRVTDDLYFDDEEGGAGLISRGGDLSPLPTSSSS